MKKLQPIFYLDTVFDVTVELLKTQAKKAVFIDVDNTLFIPKVAITAQEVMPIKMFLGNLVKEGYEVIAISNNFTEDRKYFFQEIGIPFISFAKKPLSVGFKKAFSEVKNTSIEKKDIIHIGDQVLTDGIGAHLYGIDYILIEPINHKHDLIFALPSRLLERLIGVNKKRRGK